MYPQSLAPAIPNRCAVNCGTAEGLVSDDISGGEWNGNQTQMQGKEQESLGFEFIQQ